MANIIKLKDLGYHEAHEAGGLKMVDVKSFLTALKSDWLKRSQCDAWKITKILQIMCPSMQKKLF